MKKALKVTAIILSVVAVLVTHPFLSISAKEITRRPVVLDRTQVITNSTGKLIFDGCQISYNYSIDNAQATSWNSATLNIPVIYVCDLIINFTYPVDYALITINFKTASTNKYPLNFIVEHGRVTTSNYNTITVQALHTDVVYIKLIFSLQQIIENYSYPAAATSASDPYENEWVQYGYQYFQIQSATMTSASQYEGEYIPKLNSILASVDGLESLMQSLVTSSSDIDTNVAAINNVISGISTKIDLLDSIKWLDMPYPTGVYRGYTTDFNNYDTTTGYKQTGYYVWESFRANNENNFGIYKIRIPIGNGVINFNDLKFYQIYNGDLIQFTFDVYLYQQNRSDIVIYFAINDSYHPWPNGNNAFALYVSKGIYKYGEAVTEFKYILPDDINYWTIYDTINQLKELRLTNNSLARIIQLLENMNINVTYQDVTNIVNNYDINIDQIFNVENNINTQLQQQMQNFTPDNTGILQRLNDSSILLKSVMNQINGIEIFSIPIAIALVGIVLLAIVG